MFGSPGSGKSTQAELVAQKYNMVHFNTGRYVEEHIYNPKTKHTPQMKMARHMFETGGLVDSTVILRIVTQYIQKLSKQGESIVFSGSPRTVEEAFGIGTKKGMLQVLETIYGKKMIFIFELVLSPKIAASRNKKRKICSVCNTPLIGTVHHVIQNSCPFCGGKTYTRSLDTPQVIQERLREYKKTTTPIYTQLKKRKFPVKRISASPLPYKIFQAISTHIDARIQ